MNPPINDLGKLQLDSNDTSNYLMYAMAGDPVAKDNFEKFNRRVEEVNGQLSPEELKSILQVIDQPLRTQKKEILPLSNLTREIKDLEALDKNFSKLHDLTPKLKGFFAFFNPEARALEKQYSTLKETLRNRLCETYKKALTQLESPDKSGLYQLELSKARATLQNELTSPHRSSFFSSQLEKSKAAFFNQFTKITPENESDNLDDFIARFIENPKETIGELGAMTKMFSDDQTKGYSGKQYVLDRLIYAETSENANKLKEAKAFLGEYKNMPDSEIILMNTSGRLVVFSDQKVLDDFYAAPNDANNEFKMKTLLGKLYAKKNPVEADAYLKDLFMSRSEDPTLSQGKIGANKQNFVTSFNNLSLDGILSSDRVPRAVIIESGILESGLVSFKNLPAGLLQPASAERRKAQEDYFFKTCIASLTQAIAENKDSCTLDFRLDYKDSPDFPQTFKKEEPLAESEVHKFNQGRLNDILRVMQDPKFNPRGVSFVLNPVFDPFEPSLKIYLRYPKDKAT